MNEEEFQRKYEERKNEGDEMEELFRSIEESVQQLPEDFELGENILDEIFY